jgi:ankyrin repeat protein
MSEEGPPTSVQRLHEPHPALTLADVADLVLFCGYVEEGKQLAFLTSSLYNDRSVFLATHAVGYGPYHRRTRLNYLVEKGDVDKLRSVAESAHGGLNVDAGRPLHFTPLHRACMYSDPATALELATILLDAGADPNAQSEMSDDEGTALHIASKNCLIEVVRLLLDRGMSANVRTASYRDTPLNCAHYHPSGTVQVETARLLLERGANPALTNNGDDNALHCAAAGGDEALVRLILSTGRVNIEARNNDDDTALHRAVSSRSGLGAIRALLDAGADLNALDWSGRTPLRRALDSGQEDVAELLRERGGQM